MLTIMTKADQLGLFEKIVPVAASLKNDGTYTPRHFARRKVRLPQAESAKPPAQVQKPAKVAPVVADLFAAPPAKKPPEKSESTKKPTAEPAHDDPVQQVRAKAIADGLPPDIRLSFKATDPQYIKILGAFKGRVASTAHKASGDAFGATPEEAMTNACRNLANWLKVAREAAEPKTTTDKVEPAAPPAAPKAAEPATDLFGDTPQVAKPAREPAHGDYRVPFSRAHIPAWGVPAGTSKDARRRINAEAVAIMQHDTPPTPADRAILRQYSGTGGIGDSLNEFYTDPAVATAVWYALRRLGLPLDASVLEPSCATGVFIATAPSDVQVTGVEMDPTSASIGAALHGRHEVINASLERFARTDARTFDAVIGNAPFGLRGSLLKDDKPKLSTAENYFLDTSLDKTRDGGIVAMIVPTGVVDGKNNRTFRENLLRKGEFLGALRMPNTAFEHSHTGVTTDVIFLKKRPQDVAGALGTLTRDQMQLAGAVDPEFVSGEYFTGSGAGKVLGTMTEGWRAKAGMGHDITVEGSMAGVPDEIAAFVPRTGRAAITMQSIMAALQDDETAKAKAISGALKVPYATGRAGDTKMVDGVEYVLQGSPLRWHRVDEIMQTPAVTEGQEIANRIEGLLSGEFGIREAVEADLKGYISRHGNPSKNPEVLLAAGTDKLLYRLIGAVKPDGSLSDVITGMRHAAPVESSFESAATALALESGDFTPQQVAARWHGGDAEAALDHLYASPEFALNPDGTWTSLDAYLSGELWPKLDAARGALAGDVSAPDRAIFERQAAALEKTIDPKILEDVEVNINSAFLPLRVLEAFFNERIDAQNAHSTYQQKRISITFGDGIYTFTGGWVGNIEKYLNRTGVRKDDLPAILRTNKEFKDWLCQSSYRDEVEDLYNRSFRGFRQMEFSETPFDIPGLNPEGLKSYTWSGLRWALAAGKGIIAADVGLGKTVRGLLLAKMAVINGQAKKPIIVIPKSVGANWLKEAERWFPGSRCLLIGETFTTDKDGKLKGSADSAAERNRKYHDLTQNDYDFIFITQPAWNDLDLDPITKGEYAEQDFWVQRGTSLGNAGDKRINKIRESHAQAIAKREFQNRSDAIYFNDLGVDMIIADEMHADKNLYAARNRFGETPKFLGGQGLSNRALDMFFKAKWLRSQNGGRNVYGLTATPTKNSPLEIYSMLSFIAPEAFEKIGIRNSEEFLDRFCVFRTENILGTDGNIQEALVTVGFKNMTELRAIMRRYIDRKTAAEVGLKLPERDDRMHLVDMSPEQQAVYVDLRIRAAESAGKRDAGGDAHIFSIMSDMGKAAMDLELYNPAAYAGADSPKYAEAADHIIAGAKEGGQVVFADSIGTHRKLADKLAGAGIPRKRIAIMNAQEAPTAAARQNIADAFNAGKLDVVIGNTATMGEGQNLQTRTTDIHHLDLPWEPASMQQRNGRGLRQGNLNEAIRIHTYLSKGSFDGYKYQSMTAKKDWMDLLWNGGDRIENLSREGAVSHDDMMIMLAADPEAAKKQYAENRAAAEARFKAQQNAEVSAEFARLQGMRASLAGLKNKETLAGQRLGVQIARARLKLEDNPAFTAKAALDRTDAVLVHPQTGVAYHEGVQFDMPAGDGAAVAGGGKFIVTGVTPDWVRVRRYGTIGRSGMNLSIEDLNHVSAAEPHDAEAEKREIESAVAADASGKVHSIKDFKDVISMPAATVRQHYDLIQKQMKAGAADYSFTMPHGDVAMIGPGGDPVVHASYEARRQVGDHDFMLPVPEHQEKAIEAYIADEMAKRFAIDHVPVPRTRSGKTEPRPGVQYPGKYDQKSNRWVGPGKEVFGGAFEATARKELERRQYAVARKAPTLTTAVSDLLPLATMDGYSSITPKWPHKALVTLWAKAIQNGALNSRLAAHLPTVPSRYGDAKQIDDWVFNLNDGRGSWGGRKASDVTVADALITMAKHAGHTALAGAMEKSAARTPEMRNAA